MTDLYPTDWADFIGQEQVKSQLMTAATAAYERRRPLGHVLLTSPLPGIGKTALAHLVSAQLGGELFCVSGKIDVQSARIVLAQTLDHDVLLIDEIHRMFVGGKSNGEWLLHLLQDGVLMGPAGVEKVPGITIIGTTTDGGALPDTITSRFQHRPVLVPYSDAEALQIAAKMSQRIFDVETIPRPSEGDLGAIVRASSNNPRTIRTLLVNLFDVAWVNLAEVWDGESYDLTEPLRWLGLSPDGLDAASLRYMRVLLDKFGGTAGEKIMADALREPAGVRHIERTLLERDLICLTPKGRVLTSAGIKRVARAAP